MVQKPRLIRAWHTYYARRTQLLNGFFSNYNCWVITERTRFYIKSYVPLLERFTCNFDNILGLIFLTECRHVQLSLVPVLESSLFWNPILLSLSSLVFILVLMYNPLYKVFFYYQKLCVFSST